MKLMERVSEIGNGIKNTAGSVVSAIGEKFRRKPAPEAAAEEPELELDLEPAPESVEFSEPKESAAEEIPQEEPSGVETPEKPKSVLGKIGAVFAAIGRWIFRLRKVFMAIPVVYAAFRLASENMDRLPEQVGLNLQATGEFAQMIDRNLAVYGPLGVTAACLLMMFCSRRAFYPWIISIFTLVLPLLIWVTNVYPQ